MAKYQCPLPHDPLKIFDTWRGWRTHIATHRPKVVGGHTNYPDPEPIVILDEVDEEAGDG